MCLQNRSQSITPRAKLSSQRREEKRTEEEELKKLHSDPAQVLDYRMLLCICLMLLAASNLGGFCLDDALLESQWQEWKTTHGKDYSNKPATREKRIYRSCWQPTEDQEAYRKDIWKKNMHMIEVHNQEAEQGKHSYKLGMNSLGDLTLREMAEKMTTRVTHKPTYYKGQTTDLNKRKTYGYIQMKDSRVFNTTCSNKVLPKSVDYRDKGMVTAVKYQGMCGSCWAFSAVGALEGQLAKKTNKLRDLSPQNLVDCVKMNKGCNGGHMTTAFMYVQDDGINSEKDYPYIEEVQHCRHKSSDIAAKCKGFKELPEGDECALAEALYHVGPLSLVLDTNSTKFLLYKSGIYHNPDCDENNPNHAMLLVGYSETDEGEKYWIVKNSYGTSWGDNGYIYIPRNYGNHCGIATDASYPIM